MTDFSSSGVNGRALPSDFVLTIKGVMIQGLMISGLMIRSASTSHVYLVSVPMRTHSCPNEFIFVSS